MFEIVVFGIIFFLMYYFGLFDTAEPKKNILQSLKKNTNEAITTEAALNEVEDYNFYPEPAEYPVYEKSIYSSDYNILDVKPIDSVL